MEKPTCILPDCSKPSRCNSPALCPMHYHRAYRHGDVNKSAHKSDVTVSHGRRYKMQAVKGHPLAKANNKVYVHRRVLFDTIGAGVHNCHWCGTEVEWFLEKTHERALHVDHLNNIGDDNRPENLVPSCMTCNGTRGSQRRADALREAGFWSGSVAVPALHVSVRSVPIHDDRGHDDIAELPALPAVEAPSGVAV